MNSHGIIELMKKDPCLATKIFLKLAPPTGLEPVAHGLTAYRSTDWNKEEKYLGTGYTGPHHPDRRTPKKSRQRMASEAPALKDGIKKKRGSAIYR